VPPASRSPSTTPRPRGTGGGCKGRASTTTRPRVRPAGRSCTDTCGSFDTSWTEPYERYDHDGYAYPDGHIWGGTSHQIIRCAGCKTVGFRQESHFSEEEGLSETLYPIRTKNKLTPKDFLSAPQALRRIYRETIDSFNAECVTLCAGGLRACVEGICADKKIKSGTVEFVDKSGSTKTRVSKNLDGKISGLQENGILTGTKAKLLHTHRFLGNDALHDLDMPSIDELKLAIQIIEHVLEELYSMEDKAFEIEWRRKKRKEKVEPTLAQRFKGKTANPK
jgi:hypothetical protein